MHVIELILHVPAQYRAFRSALADLGRRTDSQLADLGIDRGDVVRAAFERSERLSAPQRGDTRPAGTWPPTVTASAG
jgi:uncharacterized protein YjiS (DUF1127 family)